MKPSDGNIDQLVRNLRNMYRKLPGRAGALAIRFVLENFRKQGWQAGAGALPWVPRKAKQNGARRALLIKSGRLRRGWRYVPGQNFVTVLNDVPYAPVHNDGGTITGTQEVKEHSRRAHGRKARGRRQQVKETTVGKHTRTVNTRIPKRKMAGPSLEYNSRLDAMIRTDLDKIEKDFINAK